MSTEQQGAAEADAKEPLTPTTPPPTAGADQQDQAGKQSDDAATSGDGTTATDETAQEPKKRADGGFQRRINRLTADYRSAEAKAEAAEARARELEKQVELIKKDADTHQQQKRGPRPEDFATYDEYERADRAYVAEQASRETERRFKQAQAEAAEKAEREADAKRRTEAVERFNKAAEAVAQHYEDFAEVMDDVWRGRVEVIRRSNAVAEYIVEESEIGPQLAYHLATNQADADRIGKLSPIAQIKELVRLEASIPRPNAPATKAPNPPRTVGGRGGSDAKDPERMSIDEMRKATGTQRKVSY